MKISRRIKRTTKQYIIVALICIIVIGGAAITTTIITIGQIREEYQTLLQKAYHDIEINQRNVYVATSDIKSGETIKDKNVEKRIIYSSQSENYDIAEEELGKAALIDIPAGTQILNTMLTDNTVSSELRESEYNVISMSSNIITNDTVDVRISYANGESYIVLNKKVIKGIDTAASKCYFWLDEAELLRMSAAIVDAGLYTGTRLITTKYIEPNIQEASEVTYTPSLSILALLEKDPNVLWRASSELNKELRKELENRLALSSKLDVTTISWEENPYVSGSVIDAEDSKIEGIGEEGSNIEESNVENRKEEINKDSSSNKESNDSVDSKEENSSKEIQKSITKTGNTDTEENTKTELGSAEDNNSEPEQINSDTELGSNTDNSDFLYYADEQEEVEGVIEFGE